MQNQKKKSKQGISNTKIVISLVIIISIFITIVYASLLNPSSTGSNSETYNSNLINLTNNFYAAGFNVTQTFTNNGNTILWVPWYSSSSECGEAQLHDKDYNVDDSCTIQTSNMTLNCMVTDEFSEVGLLLAIGNNETRFDNFYNTVVAIKSYSAGTLPTWIVYRNGTEIKSMSGTNDTASDASVRIIISLYLASNNSAFTSGNRTKYKNYADNMTRDHLTYETATSCKNTNFGTICTWAAAGKNTAPNINGTINDGPYMYVGYYQDLIKAMLMAYKSTNNITYLNIAQNYTAQFLLASNYTGGTSSNNFKVANLNFVWNMSGTPFIMNTTQTTNYYWLPNTEVWDTQDAPRIYGVCDNLRIVNLTMSITGIWSNFSDYCNAWTKDSMTTSIATCMQYYKNGTCVPDKSYGGFYSNGLGGLLYTYYNTSLLSTKLDEALSHYSWTTKTYDSAACYGIYQAIRPAKLMISALGKDESFFLTSESSGGCNQTTGQNWIIDSSCSFDSDINNAGYNLTINANQTVTINGNLTIKKIIIQNGGKLVRNGRLILQ